MDEYGTDSRRDPLTARVVGYNSPVLSFGGGINGACRSSGVECPKKGQYAGIGGLASLTIGTEQFA